MLKMGQIPKGTLKKWALYIVSPLFYYKKRKKIYLKRSK